jgi:CrcB protein
VAAVAVGGAAGAVLRYALTLALPVAAAGFPWTILAVNVVGSALLALLPALLRRVAGADGLLAPLLGAGVLGGFTTLSTYTEQARALVAAGHVGLATAYVVGTLAAALGAVALADRLASGPGAGR